MPFYDEVSQSVETILLLDDDKTSLWVIRAALEAKGYQVLDASADDEAIRICQQPEHKIDLLIADIILRRSYGTETAQKLNEMCPTLPVLFISGYPIEDLESRGVLRANASDTRKGYFLQKPFLPQILVGKVREILDRKL